MGEKDKYFFKYLLQKTSVFFIRVWIKFCEYKALKIEIIQSEEKVHEEGKIFQKVGKKLPIII